MRWILALFILTVSIQSQASRIMEIEDYYSQKVSSFIKARYPRKAFSVYVKVEAEEKPMMRQPASLNNRITLPLPYLNRVDKEEISFWDRKDLSLGTLISYLRRVFIRVDLEGEVQKGELAQFKSELFQYLKLSETYDRIDIEQRAWQDGFNWKNYQPQLVFGLVGLVLFALLFFYVFQSGIARLISGLAKPLSEIGRSAENVATSSQFNLDVGNNSFHLANKRWDEEGLKRQQVEKLQKDIDKLSDYLANPDAELLQRIEVLGKQDPLAMGAIFSEMPIEPLKKLVCWANGDWWRVAITQITPLSQKSIEIVDEISHLYTRKNLLEINETPEKEEAQRSLARLNEKQFGKLLANKDFLEAEPILRLLPHETMIKVGKYLYPGQWAGLLESKENLEFDTDNLKHVINDTLELCPLKTEAEIAKYFKESDLLNLLDRSSTKDERDIYKVLDSDSWIKKERLPFYSLFQESDEILEQLTNDLPLEAWSLVLNGCDKQESEKIYQFFSAKQKFLLKNRQTPVTDDYHSELSVLRAKKKLMSALVLVKKRVESVETLGNEAHAAS